MPQSGRRATTTVSLFQVVLCAEAVVAKLPLVQVLKMRMELARVPTWNRLGLEHYCSYARVFSTYLACRQVFRMLKQPCCFVLLLKLVRSSLLPMLLKSLLWTFIGIPARL